MTKQEIAGQNGPSAIMTDAEIRHFIHDPDTYKMADLTAVVSSGQNQKLQMFKWKFLPSLGIKLNNFVITPT